MKKPSLFSCCLAIAIISLEQNVGINDPTTSARLTIKGNETPLMDRQPLLNYKTPQLAVPAFYFR